jgi:hypothetical protein
MAEDLKLERLDLADPAIACRVLDLQPTRLRRRSA